MCFHRTSRRGRRRRHAGTAKGSTCLAALRERGAERAKAWAAGSVAMGANRSAGSPQAGPELEGVRGWAASPGGPERTVLPSAAPSVRPSVAGATGSPSAGEVIPDRWQPPPKAPAARRARRWQPGRQTRRPGPVEGATCSLANPSLCLSLLSLPNRASMSQNDRKKATT
jgi:hypothetical protein